ncbi:MAG: Clp protease ClpP [Anaerolineae bacterium]
MWTSRYELARKRVEETPRSLGGWTALGADDDGSERKTIDVIDNHIYFYADIDADTGLKLMRTVHKLDKELRTQHLTHEMDEVPLTPIWLHVHSYGGSLFAGFSIADQLALVKSPLISVVEGICASAATLIAMSAAKRYILPNSFVLIHQLSTLMWGTHEQFKDEMTLQSKAMERLVEFYSQRSHVSADEVRSMLTHDYWLDAERAVEHGFVDKILR